MHVLRQRDRRFFALLTIPKWIRYIDILNRSITIQNHLVFRSFFILDWSARFIKCTRITNMWERIEEDKKEKGREKQNGGLFHERSVLFHQAERKREREIEDLAMLKY